MRDLIGYPHDVWVFSVDGQISMFSIAEAKCPKSKATRRIVKSEPWPFTGRAAKTARYRTVDFVSSNFPSLEVWKSVAATERLE